MRLQIFPTNFSFTSYSW